MKKILITLVMIIVLCAGVFAQDSYFVRANGNDDNSGLSEAEALKTLSKAFSLALQGDINKITVIGTLDVNSEGRDNSISIVQFQLLGNSSKEILITGKLNARRAERAILSAAGAGRGVLYIHNSRIRLEHIEISNGENQIFGGISVISSHVTLGSGTVVRNNTSNGVSVGEGSILIIDGGEVRDNKNAGVTVGRDGLIEMHNGSITGNTDHFGAGVQIVQGGLFKMHGGSITGNTALLGGAGISIWSGGVFEMSGGSITRNRANDIGGGVYVQRGATFTNTGGTVRNNTAGRNDVDQNIYIE